MLLILPFALLAKPADRRVRSVKQSDGTVLRIFQTGDEFFHYYCTEDGKPIVRGDNGDFYYATLSAQGNLVSANSLAHNEEERTTAEQSLLAANTYSGMENSLRVIASKRRAASTKGVLGEYGIKQSIKPIGEINVPVVLVQFKDESFTYSKDIIEKNYNGSNFVGLHGKGIGSVRDYFINQSDSIFRPNFIVLDVVTLANNMKYYGENNSSGDDKHPEEMIVEACTALDDKVDFSVFDNDGDGEVEFVYCIYAGYAESSGASENTIWPHQWTLSASNSVIKVDGVAINTYAASSELAFTASAAGSDGPLLDGIGSCCHEFSHCLGLPDFYDTSGRAYSNFGMDYWDLMDYGCYNNDGYAPIGYSAYERDFMGWRKLQTITERGHYSLAPLTSGGVGYKIVNNANSDEYYILENRQAEGFDKYIFNSGMLIIHVDYSKSVWFDNEVNYNLARQRYTIIPADNKQLPLYRAASAKEYEDNLRGDVWPGTSNNRELTDVSTPAAKVYTGGYMSKSIKNISHVNGIVNFSFLWDKLPEPVLLQPQNVTDNSFTAMWKSVTNASSYDIELFSIDDVAVGDGDVKELMFEDFLGCNRSNTDITNSINDYTIVDGWYGLNLWSETGVLRIGTSNEYGELVTPYFGTPHNGEVKVSFIAKKYSSTDGNVKLSVCPEFVDSEILDDKIFDISNDWRAYELTFPKRGEELCVVFSTDKTTDGKARVYIDDIVVSQASTEREILLGCYNTVDSYYCFKGLKSGKYRYRVKALGE
ncbi:MAG: M6 family metalloprotease domain-containing protein, partial [Bacteroidaceae bacterium]|nr:M6 family metalloprotease domain-containing protein [Bacteroidaceae bacterium]